MKKFLVLSAAVLALAGSAVAAEKIVFINFERTFNEFYKTRLAKTKMEAQKRDVDAEIKLMADEMAAISAEIDVLRKDARDVTLADEIRDSKRLLYEERVLVHRTKQKELEEFTAMKQKQLQVQVSRMSRIVMDEIQQTVLEYAKREGFLAVIDNSSRGAAIGTFVYTHPDVEITDAVLKVLNSKRSDAAETLFDDSPEVEEKPVPEGGVKPVTDK